MEITDDGLGATDWNLAGGGFPTLSFNASYFEYQNVGVFFDAPIVLFPTSGLMSLFNDDTNQSSNIASITLSSANGGTIGFTLETAFAVTPGVTVSVALNSMNLKMPISINALDALGMPYYKEEMPTASGMPDMGVYVGTTAAAVPEVSSFLLFGLLATIISARFAYRRYGKAGPSVNTASGLT